MKQNQGNKQKNIQSKPLRKIMVMTIAILIVFTACHKKNNLFLLLPLIDNSSVATTDNGSGNGGSGSGAGSSGNGGSGSGAGSFGNGGSGSGAGSSGNGGSGNSNNNNSGSNNSSSNNSGNNNSGSSGNTFTGAIGVLDTSFNSPNGFIIQPIGSSNDWGYSLAIQSDGKILLGGNCNNDFCIARFNSNGTLDTSFGSSGKVIQPIGSYHDLGYSLAIQSDGKILLGGYCYNGGDGDFCIARFNSNGTLDTSFGSSGKVIQPIGSWNDYGNPLAIQPDGKILLGGFCFNRSNWDFCIARFNSNGTLDTSFGSNGKVIQDIGLPEDYGFSLAIQSDGKILLGGYCKNGSNFYFCIARFNSNGTLDTSFGSSGKVIQPIGSSYDNAYSLAIQPDGKILLGGYCKNGSNFYFCIARFNSNGTLDTSFGSSGKVIQSIGIYGDFGSSLAIQPDGKILLGGNCRDVSNDDFCIARFNSNGTLDTSFGTGGKVIQPIGSYNELGYSLVIQPDGKILLGGRCYNGSDYDFCIARFK
jgi:uncharacterized delta-60 repeat protein